MARYIDADAFLEAEIKRCGCVPLIGTCTTDNESLAYQLAKTPTADVEERKHGEWLWDTEDIYECSVCGIETRVDEVMGMPTYKYCPNCGAKMDGGKEK